MPEGIQVFRRIAVDNFIVGTRRVWWQLDPRFDPGATCFFQLQHSHSGTPTATDWTNVGDIAENTFHAVDDVQRLHGKTLNSFYRVTLTYGDQTIISPVANCFGELPDNDWLLMQEIIRKERLRGEFVSIAGTLLKRMRYGARCPRCRDQLTEEVTDGHCDICNGTGYRIGYHPGIPLCVDKSLETISETTDAELRGPINDEVVTGRVVGFPVPMQKEDVWVDDTDRRWYVDKVAIVAAKRSMPIILELTLKLLPFSNAAYKIPLCGQAQEEDLPDGGDGCVTVDHDFGGTDALQYLNAAGAPVEGATVLAFYTSVYTANSGQPPATLAVASTTTDAAGRWTSTLRLNPGSYTLVFQLAGAFGPDTAVITVNHPPSSFSSLSVD